jgi:hypothetical protein
MDTEEGSLKGFGEPCSRNDSLCPLPSVRAGDGGP